jgi:phosphohistidine phosphatase
MKLYLVQHAKAVSKEVDPQRPLTEEGLRDLQKIASFIKPLNLSIDYLWHSQKKRAIQTADILAEVIEIKQSRTERSDLGPNDDVARLTNEIGSLEHDIMIVGHLPFLSKLASLIGQYSSIQAGRYRVPEPCRTRTMANRMDDNAGTWCLILTSVNF